MPTDRGILLTSLCPPPLVVAAFFSRVKLISGLSSSLYTTFPQSFPVLLPFLSPEKYTVAMKLLNSAGVYWSSYTFLVWCLGHSFVLEALSGLGGHDPLPWISSTSLLQGHPCLIFVFSPKS